MRRGWIIVLSSFVQFILFIGVLLHSYNLLNLQVKQSFNCTATKSGMPGSISLMVYSLAGPATTVVFQQFGHMVSAYLGTCFCCIGLLLTSVSDRIELTYFTYGVLFGYGCSTVYFTSVDKIVKYYKRCNTIRALGIVHLGSSIGLLMSPGLEWLYSKYTWRYALRMISALFALLGCMTVCSFTIKHNDNSSETEIQDGTSTDQKRSFRQRYSDLAKRKTLTVMIPGYVAVGAAITFSYVSLGSYLNHVGLEESTIALTLALLGFGELIGKCLISLIGVHIPTSPTFQFGCINILSAILFIPLIMLRTSVGIAVILFAFGIARGWLVVLMVPSITHLSPENSSAEAVAIEFVLQGTGSLLAPYITDLLFDIKGNYNIALSVVIGLYGFSGFVTFVADGINRRSYRLARNLQQYEIG